MGGRPDVGHDHRCARSGDPDRWRDLQQLAPAIRHGGDDRGRDLAALAVARYTVEDLRVPVSDTQMSAGDGTHANGQYRAARSAGAIGLRGGRAAAHVWSRSRLYGVLADGRAMDVPEILGRG